jgi:hypothetical protein
MIPGASQEKRKLLKNSQQILCHVKPLGVGFTVTWRELMLCHKGCLSHQAHPHQLYPTQNIPFGGVIRK